jgi:hypothetical protein
MRYEDENIWLTQKMMATLYDVDVRTISEHIQKIFMDRELVEDSTIRNFRIVQIEGTRQVERADAEKEHMGLTLRKKRKRRQNRPLGCEVARVKQL